MIARASQPGLNGFTTILFLGFARGECPRPERAHEAEAVRTSLSAPSLRPDFGKKQVGIKAAEQFLRPPAGNQSLSSLFSQSAKEMSSLP